LEAKLIRSTIAGSWLAISFLLFVSIARADANSTLAESLFSEGRQLMKAGKIAEACPKFEESYRLDPAGGTLLNVALCHEKAGRTATAWAELKDARAAARKDGRADREKLATEHLEKIEPTLSKLTVIVAPDAEVTGLEIRVDNTVIGKAVRGTALPFDPGSHVVTATAPGKKPWTASTTLGASRDQKQMTVPALADDPTANAAESPSAPPVPAATPPPSDVGLGTSNASTRTLVLAGEAVLAAAGLAVGIGYTVAAGSAESKAHDDQAQIDARGLGQACRAPAADLGGPCADLASTLSDRDRDRNLATAGFVTAGLGAAALVTTWLVWKPSNKQAMHVAIDPLGRRLGLGWRY
jgi:hypothetical protein